MFCDQAQKLMILADSLSKDERVGLEEHLSRCPSCTLEWQKWQKLFSLLRHLPSISSTPEERTQLMQSLHHVIEVPELDCATAQSFIWQWIDNDLSPQEQASLTVHLANCDKCQAALWRAEQTVLMLRSLPQLKAAAAEKEALKARLRQMGKRPSLVPFVWRVAFPIAAAAALVLTVFVRWHLPIRDQTVTVQTVREELTKPSLVQTQPTAPKMPTPRVTERTEQPKPKEVRPPQVLAQTQQPAKRERVQTVAGQKVQISETRKQPQVKQMIVPEPRESFVSVPTPVETNLKEVAPETLVVEAPKVAMPTTVTVPIPSQVSSLTPTPAPTVEEVVAASSQVPQIQQVQESPATASLDLKPRQLVALPPITLSSENDLTLQPPRVQLTVVPPSQRLYQKSGVALITVPPEKRPVKVIEGKDLTPDFSIPLAAERYRSHTALIPFLRFGISW